MVTAGGCQAGHTSRGDPAPRLGRRRPNVLNTDASLHLLVNRAPADAFRQAEIAEEISPHVSTASSHVKRRTTVGSSSPPGTALRSLGPFVKAVAELARLVAPVATTPRASSRVRGTAHRGSARAAMTRIGAYGVIRREVLASSDAVCTPKGDLDEVRSAVQLAVDGYERRCGSATRCRFTDPADMLDRVLRSSPTSGALTDLIAPARRRGDLRRCASRTSGSGRRIARLTMRRPAKREKQIRS